jgi:hypothetical protein
VKGSISYAAAFGTALEYMTRKEKDPPRPDISADPFRERLPPIARGHLQLLGGHVEFQSNSVQLMRLVDSAYANLPPHKFAGAIPRLRVRLELTSRRRRDKRLEPPPFEMLSGAGFLCEATGSSNFVAVSPRERTALVVVSNDMLRFAYHTRYELIEFAVFTLAARVQSLVPLHAACVAHGGRGILLMGQSGAGKSTVALHCLLHGFDFVSEDSVFVAPSSMLATGVANFLHVRSNSLHFLARAADAARIRKSPVIRRRSGVEKFEVDLRRLPYRLAPAPVKLEALIFISAERAGGRALVEPLAKRRLLANLRASQAYAANQAQWAVFEKSALRLRAFELRRGRHPLEAVEALRPLIWS